MTTHLPDGVGADAPHVAQADENHVGGPAPRPAESPADRRDTIELLGLVAQLEDVAFARLAADAALAPTAEQRLALSRFAASAVVRRDRVLARITELGGDPVAALRQYDHVLDDFDARTQPSSWWERLLKAYVGYGVADDFCRIAAEGLDETSRALVLEILDDASHADLAVAELDAAGSSDGVLTSRLALWGRRLVGESLGVVQRLLVQRPGLVRVLTRTRDDELPEADANEANTNQPSKLFGELTAQHTRRMSRLGLTA